MMVSYKNLKCKQVLSITSLFALGVTVGVLLNYYGLLFENISVHVTLDDPLLTNGSSKPTPVYKVPNIVHFIWFGENREMKFLNYISILSAHRIQKPDAIFLHCNHLPVGQWWEKLWREVPIKIYHREPPSEIHGQRLLHVFHKGDIAKMEILMEHGGIYLDCDVIVVNPMNELRRYDATLGKEKPPKLIAGIIVARAKAPFLKLWYESYRDNYRALDWDYNCARVAYQIYLKRQDLLHVEPYKLTTPDWKDRHQLFDEVIEWRKLYCIHVMQHELNTEYNPNNIKDLDSTFGEAVRYIYYGNSSRIR